MLRFALAMFVLAVIAAIFGFGGLAGSFSGIAQLALGVFVVLFVISFLANLLDGNRSLA